MPVQVSDKEYLSRPLLEVDYIITENEVNIHSVHTSYVNSTRIQRIAKAKGVQIAYTNHYKRTINENWDRYREEFKYYNEVFDKMIAKFKVVEKRGIHQGTRDDIVLEEATKVSWEYGKCYYRTSSISRIHSIAKDLERHHRDLQYPDCNYYKIYL